MALQALAKYAKVEFGSNNMTVDVAAAGQTNSYSISSSNALLLQSRVVSSPSYILETTLSQCIQCSSGITYYGSDMFLVGC